MAENRLFQMLFVLLEKGSSTAPELAERFEVSVRTIYRDIDILSAAGIPIYTTQGKGGGIFLQENYVLNKSLLSEQEQNLILSALQGLNIIDEENTNVLLSKLGGIFRKQNVNWIEVDFSEWNKKSEELFHLLQSAIFQSKIVHFRYYSGKGECRSRTVEPLKLVFKSGAWYLYAYCHLRQDCRLFKLVRIKDLEITAQHFIRTTPERVLEDIQPYTDETVALTLLFSRELACRVYENFEKTEETADGDYLVNISLPNNESLYPFIFSFGDRVEVLAPPEVRKTVINRINKMKSKYET